MVVTTFRKALVVTFLALALAPITAQCQIFRVTLLGTGSPPPVVHRFGPSILVQAGQQKFVFDARRAAARI